MNNINKIQSNRNMIIISLVILFLSFAGAALARYYFNVSTGPEQPIHFSHRIHTTQKGISCFMCHDRVIETARSGIPPLQTCMLCHERIIIHHPEIEKLHAYFNEGEPVEWIKVQYVPDFVFFDHSVHIHRKIDCSRCHGNVKRMDRIEQVNKFNMGFCIDCHKQNGATTDCFTCHR